MTPSRAHHAAALPTPGPQPGCAGSGSSALSGTAVIADGPSRGACSAHHPQQAPVRHHRCAGHPRPLRLPQRGAFRRQRPRGDCDTCTVSSPLASFDSTGI